MFQENDIFQLRKEFHYLNIDTNNNNNNITISIFKYFLNKKI